VRSRATDADDARRRAGTLSLRDQAGDIVAPILVVCGREDRLVSWTEGERLAGGVGGPAELLLIEHGNHGCANAAPWHRPYTADWVAARLGRWTA
jgi:2,6-dihydroxypseudooxynicotine hydrolase